MADAPLTLTSDERQFLAELLDWAYKETLVEERRTDSLTYRAIVRHREQMIADLLKKLQQAAR